MATPIWGFRQRIMENRQLEMYCSACDKRVTLQEDFCFDEDGNAAHTDCYVKRILQDNGWLSGTAA